MPSPAGSPATGSERRSTSSTISCVPGSGGRSIAACMPSNAPRDDAVDAQQRAGAGRVAQPQRSVGELGLRDERDGRLVRAALGEANAHQSVAVSRSFALVQFARGAFFESSTYRNSTTNGARLRSCTSWTRNAAA